MRKARQSNYAYLYSAATLVFALCVLPQINAHSGFVFQILKGQSIEIDLRELCISETNQCDQQKLTVQRQPTEGVIFTDMNSDVVRYQHAGTSTGLDDFEIAYIDGDKSRTFRVEIAVTSKTPKLIINSPLSGASIKSEDIEINFRVEGNGVDHVHFSLLDNQHFSVDPTAEHFTIQGISPGSYVLKGSLASSLHKDIKNTTVLIPIELIQ